jgi:hypothetical protein
MSGFDIHKLAVAIGAVAYLIAANAPAHADHHAHAPPAKSIVFTSAAASITTSATASTSFWLSLPGQVQKVPGTIVDDEYNVERAADGELQIIEWPRKPKRV